MCFLEFVECLVNFGLFNYDAIVMFVFWMIDVDNDEVVTMKDIYNFVSRKWNDWHIFSINTIHKVELLELDED